MTIEELVARKESLEEALRILIGQELSEFEGGTGVGVRSVGVDLVDVSRMPDVPGSRHQVARVVVEVDLGRR